MRDEGMGRTMYMNIKITLTCLEITMKKSSTYLGSPEIKMQSKGARPVKKKLNTSKEKKIIKSNRIVLNT